MAFFEIKDVRIVGMAAGVPSFVVNNLQPLPEDSISSDYSPEEFVKNTGVKERHISFTQTTSDLCFHAAEKLIEDLEWSREDIDAIIFVSQSRDYVTPATSGIIQNRLGLSVHTYCIDLTLGCSGWVYGLHTITSLMSTGTIKKALLMAGDSKAIRPMTLSPLFGHAGTVTALEYQKGAPSFRFHCGTDGSGYDAIIIPDGASRNLITPKSFEFEECEDGKKTRMQARMKGMDVFSFGITAAPKSIKKLSEHYGFDYLDYDYLVLHQANMAMNNMIVKKLKFPAEKVPSCMAYYGNTSSASIPLTIVSQLKNEISKGSEKKVLCCGFGVGLSWASVAFSINQIVISDIVEVDESGKVIKC